MFADIEFWEAALLSPTFRGSLIYLGMLIAIFLLLVYLAKYSVSRVSWMRKDGVLLALSNDKRGSANAVDFVLVMPFFMFIMCLFVQMAMIVNASLIVHYAAYSAARTASVHFCHRTVVEYPVGFVLGCNLNKAEREALKAAQYVLIAASPVDDSVPSTGNPPNHSLQLLADDYLKRKSPLLTQARYAFDSRNVDVDVELPASPNIAIQTQLLNERFGQYADVSTNLYELTDRKLLNTWPVTAKVEYVKHLGVPLVGPFLSNMRRGNDHFRTIEAQITLL